MKGQWQPIEWRGTRYVSHRHLARALKLNASTLHTRLEWLPENDRRLGERYLLPRSKPLPKVTETRVPMYVRTFMNGWREWVV